jgi:hypothetical protein
MATLTDNSCEGRSTRYGKATPVVPWAVLLLLSRQTVLE